MTIDAKKLNYRTLNEKLRCVDEECTITSCMGQRFIASGMSNKSITIEGIPGNALGSYFNGGTITVHGNAQDAVGDTMNDGTIIIHGNIGDAAGYAMRGGKIYVKGNAGYRAGIHMKAYKEKVPLMIIGGRAGSFLGEYQSGGVIVVLDLKRKEKKCVGFFPCTGMHGGKMFLRSRCEDVVFPSQVVKRNATDEDKMELRGYLKEYCDLFALDLDEILSSEFTVVTPDSKNPYRQMYVAN
ncbi:MAG: glutamate synthase [Sphaerochaetaceae bacterium]|nr:glutamate synthase [Sphaerochaetaceae bacterium]